MPRKKRRISQIPRRRLATIMFTDIVGYTALTQKNEDLALQLLDEHRRMLRPLFANHEGKEIKTIGDAFLVEFPSALAAARCAIQIQRTITEHNASSPLEKGFQLRIGLHLSDVEHRENDLYGDGVNIASQIEPLAEPGGICISEDVARQIENKLKEPILRLGKSELKNVHVPMSIYRIVLPWESNPPALSQRLFFSLMNSKHAGSQLIVAVLLLLLLFMMWPWSNEQESPGMVPLELPESADDPYPDISSSLRALLDDAISPSSLRVTYEEIHPTQDGPRLTIKGTGQVQQEGALADAGMYPDLSPAEIENLVRLLLDIEAWEQRAPWRETASDEIRAYLRVQVGGSSSEIWEWYDELDENRRIVQLLDQLKKVALLRRDLTVPERTVTTQASVVSQAVTGRPSTTPAGTVQRQSGTQSATKGPALDSHGVQPQASPGAGEEPLPDVSRSVPAVASVSDGDRTDQAVDITEARETVRTDSAEDGAEGVDRPVSPQDLHTELLAAIRDGQIERVQDLINAGADPDTRTEDGVAILTEAAGRGHTETVQLLLNAGAQVDAKQKNGFPGSIFRAVGSGLRFLGGVERSDSSTRLTPLMMAASKGHSDTAKALLDRGTSVRAKDDLGQTALMMAAAAGHTGTVRMLLESGADADAKDKEGRTALMMAASSGHTKIVELRLRAQVKINARDKQDHTALMVASEKGHSDIAQLLKQAGAEE